VYFINISVVFIFIRVFVRHDHLGPKGLSQETVLHDDQSVRFTDIGRLIAFSTQSLRKSI